MNFGNWIVVSFILFAVFIGTLVTVCVRQDVSLVSKNYYSEELDYQHQIERERNTNLLQHKPSFDMTGRILTLAWNQPMPISEGTIKVFCPAHANMDRTFSLSAASDRQSFDLHDLGTGMYRVKLRWTMDNKQFYQEEVINL
jgi:hypothetical protein